MITKIFGITLQLSCTVTNKTYELWQRATSPKALSAYRCCAATTSEVIGNFLAIAILTILALAIAFYDCWQEIARPVTDTSLMHKPMVAKPMVAVESTPKTEPIVQNPLDAMTLKELRNLAPSYNIKPSKRSKAVLLRLMKEAIG